MDLLQDSLDSSWHDEEDLLEQHHQQISSHHRPADLSSLALNLSSQTEYNNELLVYIQHLEGCYSQAQSEHSSMQRRHEEAEQRAAESCSRADEMQNRLAMTAALYEDLVLQQAATSEQADTHSAELARMRIQISELEQQKQQLVQGRATGKERESALESQLAELQRRRLISDDDCADSLATLTITLETTTADLDRERKLHYELQQRASLLQDENIQMTRRLEHFMREGQDGRDDREQEARRARAAATALVALQQEASSAAAERDQLQQALSSSRVALSSSESAREEAERGAAKADLMWREMEEVSKEQEREARRQQERLEQAMDRARLLEARLAGCADKEQQLERMLKEEHDRKTDAMRTKLEDLQQQLNRANLRLETVNERSDQAAASSTERIEELNSLLQASNDQLLASAATLKKQRADESSRVLQLERLVHDLRQQLRTAVEDERTAAQGQVRELVLVREQMAARSQRYSATVAGLHDAVHALSAEGSRLRDQLAFLSCQQERLLLVLQQMAPRQNSLLRQSEEQPRTGAGHPVLGPLHDYGIEMQRTLEAVVQKVVQSRQQQQEAQVVEQGLRADLQQQRFEQAELRGQLSVAEESLSMARSKVVRLEGQAEETAAEASRAGEAARAERDKLTARLDKSEGRVADMIRQNTVAQAELRRGQAEHQASASEAEVRYGLLSNKLLRVASERDEAHERERQADARHSDLQAQLVQADARDAKQQGDFRRLKKVALSLKEDLTIVTNSSRDQLAALEQVLGQLRVQLDKKQQLIGALQQQRTELTLSNEKLQAVVRELREQRGGGTDASFTVGAGQRGQGQGQGMRFHPASAAMQTHVSSSSAASSAQALSGLARLVHGHSSREEGFSFRHGSSGGGGGGGGVPASLSMVQGRDIGASVFSASLRHLSASLKHDGGGKEDWHNNGESGGRFELPESPARPPAHNHQHQFFADGEGREGSRQHTYAGRGRAPSFEDDKHSGGGERADRREVGIFHLTSPAKDQLQHRQ